VHPVHRVFLLSSTPCAKHITKPLANMKKVEYVHGMPRRETTDRLPDPEIVREGRVAINNVEKQDLPGPYLEIVKDILPLRPEGEDEK
jgi:hypothetical protein